MVHIGIDLHKRESQICWLDGDTGEVRQQRIQTRRDRFETILQSATPASVLIEAGTESEWVAQCIETLGHHVHVVDPGYAPMYPQVRSRRHKNDARDALALATASLRLTYRDVHRVPTARWRVREVLTMRETLIRTRSRLLSVVRADLRREGLRVPSGAPSSFGRRVRSLILPDAVAASIAPVLSGLDLLETQLLLLESQLDVHVAEDAAMGRLMTAPGVGAVTSAAYVTSLDTPDRFPGARQVASYLGLTPKDDSTGDSHHAGRISKAGSTRVRYLLVQAAWVILRSPRPEAQGLRQWGLAVAARRGHRVAIVAVARRLARILYAMWRDGQEFSPRPTPQVSTTH